MSANNCGCGCDSNPEPKPISNCGCGCSSNQKSKEELLKEIMELDFAVNDLALYLDTHPCCQKALMLHNEYAMKLEKLKKEYTRHYGPLSIFDEVDSWTTWVENPWPWERGAY